MANPPPPYANITGISRAAMKDNAQESITNYNGNARPGELIVDQNTDILYVGNALGQLTVLATPSGTTTWALLNDKNNASGPTAIALGALSGATSQGDNAVAIGNIAAEISQGIGAVAIGYSAGYSNQGANAVSIGLGAGSASQGVNAVAVGIGAGNDAQGANAVAIGNEAGVTSQGDNSIIINATGATLNQTTPNTFTVAPVRNDIANTAQVMFYNATSKEITYGNTISVAGNVAGNYFIGNGSQLSGLSTSSISNGTSNVRIATANGNVTIAANASSTWTFDATGNLTLPANGDLNFNNGGITQSDGDDFDLQSVNDGVVSSSLSMRPGMPSMRLEQWSGQDSNSWTTSDWATGTYTTQGGGESGAVAFTGAANIINFVNSLTGTGQIYFSVNGGPQLASDGTSSGATTITFFTTTPPAINPTTVTSFEYYYSYKSGFEIDYDDRDVNIYANDADMNLETTNQRNINLNSSRDLGMQGNGSVTLRNNSTINGIQIQTDTGNTNRTWTFDATGNLKLPGNTFAVKYANSTPVDVVTRFESTWTVATGNSTQSFTVDTNNSYQMWVDCNIANGIIVWNATATVTNTNVPVVGAQYAWVYSGGGTPINLTSIPTQFTGTANTIVSSNGSGLGNTNVFVFGFNNTSGVAQTVRYGWIQIS